MNTTARATHHRCWNCTQPARNVFTREGSITLHACDNCTRIDRAEAETRGWLISAEMDVVADQRAAAWNAEHPSSAGSGEQTYDVVACRDFANNSRVAALIATIGGSVSTMPGWILAPHPLHVRCTRTTVSVTTQGMQTFTAPLSDLPGTAAALLAIAADAARACRSKADGCDDCAKWAASIA